LLQEIDHCSGIFLFDNSSYFWLCVSIMPLEHCVIAEAGCNWYLININMFPLLKNVYVNTNVLDLYISGNNCV
jgi:hypothetical protein